MFIVTTYELPYIFVTDRRTAETYKFAIGDDGALIQDDPRLNQGEARQVAIEYLSGLSRAVA